MKLFQFVLCALTYQASYQAVVKERILYGNEAVEGQFRYQVRLMTKFFSQDIHSSCGASLISERHVLTAQHCLVKGENPVKEPFVVAMAFGTINSKDEELSNAIHDFIAQHGQYEPSDKKIRVCTMCWTLHPNYTGFRRISERGSDWILADIAIIHLQREVQFSATIQPAKLPSWSDRQWELTGKTALVAGWGLNEHQRPSYNLLFTRFKIANNSMCLSPNISLDSFCTIRETRNTSSTCGGDSGGPVIVDNKQVGIVSHGQREDCFLSNYEAYASVIYHLGWISQKTNLTFEN